MMTATVGTWGGTDFATWYRKFDGVATSFALTPEERFTALVAGVGFDRIGDYMAQAKAEGRIPAEAAEAKKDTWLAKYLSLRSGVTNSGFTVSYARRTCQNARAPVASYSSWSAPLKHYPPLDRKSVV